MVSRATVSKWSRRWLAEGEDGSDTRTGAATSTTRPSIERAAPASTDQPCEGIAQCGTTPSQNETCPLNARGFGRTKRSDCEPSLVTPRR